MKAKQSVTKKRITMEKKEILKEIKIGDWTYAVPAPVLKYQSIIVLDEGKEFPGYVSDHICSVIADFIEFRLECNKNLKGLILDYDESKKQVAIRYAATTLGTIDILVYTYYEDKEVGFMLDLNIDPTEYSIKTSLETSDIEMIITLMLENLLVKKNINISTVIISELASRLERGKFSKYGNNTICYIPEVSDYPSYDLLKIINANEKAVSYKYMGREITNRFSKDFDLEEVIKTMYNICNSTPTKLIDLMAAISNTLPYAYVVRKDLNGLPVIEKKSGEPIAKIDDEHLVFLGKKLSIFSDNTMKILELISKITIK